MFKVGEKVVCIDPICFGDGTPFIKLNKVYSIKNTHFIHNKNNNLVYRIILNECDWVSVNPKKFKSLTQFRRKKLEKICSRLEKNSMYK